MQNLKELEILCAFFKIFKSSAKNEYINKSAMHPKLFFASKMMLLPAKNFSACDSCIYKLETLVITY